MKIKSRIKAFLKRYPRIFFILTSPIAISFKLIDSKSPYIRTVGKLIGTPIFLLFGAKYYKARLIAKRKTVNETHPIKKINFLPDTTIIKLIESPKKIDFNDYKIYLKNRINDYDNYIDWTSHFMSNGRLDLAKAYTEHILTLLPNNKIKQIEICRTIGIINFLLGDNKNSINYWTKAGKIRRTCYEPSTPKNYRILGSSWFLAIGHIAMLDYFTKFLIKKLNGEYRVAAVIDKNKIPGIYLLKKFEQCGFVFFDTHEELVKDYNSWATLNSFKEWKYLSEYEQAAMIDEFWEYEFEDGEILGYAHAAARIQKEWEEKSEKPLLQISQDEIRWTNDYLQSIGLPKNAWYVCLHVRESGFHKDWNSNYPHMRDADVHTYIDSIHAITDAGGWVIRMGDQSMKPLPTMKNVIDYAHHKLKDPIADILITSQCKFFIGTNSGFAIIASIFNRPCLLTNWVPIGWPMWSKLDTVIPKLFKRKANGEILSLNEIFDENLAFLQDKNQLPDTFEIIDNNSIELKVATLEILKNISNNSSNSDNTFNNLIELYPSIARKYDSYFHSNFSIESIKYNEKNYSDFNFIKESL